MDPAAAAATVIRGASAAAPVAGGGAIHAPTLTGAVIGSAVATSAPSTPVAATTTTTTTAALGAVAPAVAPAVGERCVAPIHARRRRGLADPASPPPRMVKPTTAVPGRLGTGGGGGRLGEAEEGVCGGGLS